MNLFTTLDAALAAVSKHKPMTKRHFRRLVGAAGIRPVGNYRTRPRMYPYDTAERVLAHLGLNGHAPKLPSMRELKETRTKTATRNN